MQQQLPAFARLVFAVLALLFGLISPVHAGPPQAAPPVEAQLSTWPDQLPSVIQVHLVAYRAHGPPSVTSFLVFMRGHPHSAVVTLWAYCDGDPVNRSDPSGLAWEMTEFGWKEIEPFGSDPIPPMDFRAPIGSIIQGGEITYPGVGMQPMKLSRILSGERDHYAGWTPAQVAAENVRRAQQNHMADQYEAELRARGFQPNSQGRWTMNGQDATVELSPEGKVTVFLGEMALGSFVGLGPISNLPRLLRVTAQIAGASNVEGGVARKVVAGVTERAMASEGVIAGRRASKEFIEHLGGLLGKDKAILHDGAYGSKLIAEKNAALIAQGKPGNVAALFRVENGIPKLIIGENASRYEAMHEYFHFLHFKRLGSNASVWAKVTEREAEQEAFNAMFRSPLWKNLSREERRNAEDYLRSVGGDPDIAAYQAIKRQLDGTNGVRLGE